MENCLPAATSSVDHDAIAIFGNAELFGDLLYSE
jgi:hypothetical protein